jgi:hypothetical protein
MPVMRKRAPENFATRSKRQPKILPQTANSKEKFMFRNKVESAYSVVTADAMENKFKKLIADIVSLDYAPAEEQKLLNALKETYKEMQKSGKQRAQASVVLADMNWEAIIKENREKKARIKQDMIEQNKSTLRSYRLEHRPAAADQQHLEPIKRKVAREVENMGNVVKFDFRHPERVEQKKEGIRQKNEDDFGGRLGRIRTSLEKINKLMSELKKISSEEQKKKTTKLKPVKTGKPRTYGKGKKKSAPKKKAG